MKKIIGMALILGVLFASLHSTPKMALRFHILFMGYPNEALITDISDNKMDNRFHKKKLAALKEKTYILTKPPFEKQTKSKLDTFRVRKIGFLYFAEYYSLF
ncbi:hypothetical protein [Neobacillus mesonae]|uniref:hypothetical protein n=1 Tax=Neobacillus mesonae TaxID=1193713 RepID=UPI002E1E1CA7|nr:hypothetical protein [Neobacillus mesonae]